MSPASPECPDRSERPDRRGGATSESLLERVRANDGEAWDRLVALYAPLVWRCCARLPRDDAADVFQDVFQAAAARIETFRRRSERDTFRGWLRTLARNKVNDHFRRLEREPRGVGGTELQVRLAQVPDPGAEARDVPDELADVWLYRDALELVRGQFQERTWQAFWRTAVDGRTPAHVGEELGMSPGAVRVAKSRVLARLRSELGDLLV